METAFSPRPKDRGIHAEEIDEMGREILQVPEEQLGDVIDVIERGIGVTIRGDIKHETLDMLMAWCLEMRELLYAHFDKKLWPKEKDFTGLNDE